ncbi:DUF4260 domain-containing protein [Larkinella sp. VNQ87]|uniref:DUF4260 domain-containing protein n=1 Tax=Larkinella sp. VNQ87 TaxID=3400921 RepID=UPI003BFAB427
MKTVLKLEEAAQFILSIVLFNQLPFTWWWFPALILVPDVSMLGYLINPRVGAWTYNVAHHKAVAIAFGIAGLWLNNPVLMLTGVILFGHAAMDRMMGYGLKYPDDFTNTHLGRIGKKAAKPNSEAPKSETRPASSLSIS